MHMTSRINTKNDNYVRTINETNEKSTKITFVNSKMQDDKKRSI